MGQEKFRVKFGLAVGDNTTQTTMSVDGTTGDIVTAGSAAINGGNITTTATNAAVFNSNATTVNAFGAATTLNIGNSGGTTTVNGNLDVQGGTISESTGALTISTGAANGSITLDPNGTGNVVMTLADGGNLTSNRSIITGAIRSGTGATAGNYTWALNGALATQPFRGVSVDNSANTGVNAGYVARNYSATGANRSRIIFERARGTAASPTAVQSGDFIGSIEATGCNANGVFINDALQTGATTTTIPGFMSFTAAETWSAGTGTGPIFGTGFGLSLAPTATPITSGASLIACLAINPQTFASRSDAFTWANGKTGTTQTMALDVSGNLTITNDLRINGNDIQGSGGVSAISLTSANTFTTIRGDNFLVNNAAGTNYFQTYKDGANHIVASVNQLRATTADEFALINFTTQRSTDGINYTPTLSGDILGSFKFNGNANTSTSPGVPAGPGAQITATATENWSATANGTKFNFNAIKTGTTTDLAIIQGASTATTFQSDAYTFKNSSGTNITGNKIDYNRVYGAFQYNTTVTPVAANTAYVFPIGTADFNNIVTVGSTSRIILGAAGIYNLQFSVQVTNADNAERTAYIWLRKNGTDVTASMGRITIIKSGSLIAGWNYYIDSANTTDYYEIAYAVDDTDVIFPTYAATAFGPSTASLITTISPVGA